MDGLRWTRMTNTDQSWEGMETAAEGGECLAAQVVRYDTTGVEQVEDGLYRVVSTGWYWVAFVGRERLQGRWPDADEAIAAATHDWLRSESSRGPGQRPGRDSG